MNPGLVKYGENLFLNGDIDEESSCPTAEKGLRWLLPLCGKTVDMAYLATQETTAQVVGVDGIRKALMDFAKENSHLEIQSHHDNSTQASGPFERFIGKKIELLKGDFFALNEHVTGGRFDVVMDRAAMVAIDPSLRDDYVSTTAKLVKPGASILLMTVERRTGDEEAIKKGPPFSISEAEVRRLYETKDWVESVTLLEEIDEFSKNPDSKDKFEGITSMYELHLIIKIK